MDIVFDFVNLNVAKCLRQECRIMLFTLEKTEPKKKANPKNYIPYIDTKNCCFFV